MRRTKPLTPKAARESAGLTRTALAAAVPCSLALVYRVERRETFPAQPAMRIAYLRALGLQSCP
jgi:ribosome-binding protein aMBF1 (putative translation factor)